MPPNLPNNEKFNDETGQKLKVPGDSPAWDCSHPKEDTITIYTALRHIAQPACSVRCYQSVSSHSERLGFHRLTLLLLFTSKRLLLRSPYLSYLPRAHGL